MNYYHRILFNFIIVLLQIKSAGTRIAMATCTDMNVMIGKIRLSLWTNVSIQEKYLIITKIATIILENIQRDDTTVMNAVLLVMKTIDFKHGLTIARRVICPQRQYTNVSYHEGWCRGSELESTHVFQYYQYQVPR